MLLLRVATTNRPRHAPLSDRADHLPRVAIVAHGVHDHGGMERALAEVIKRIHDRYEIVVISSDLGDELHALVRWVPVRVPKRPIPLRFTLFYVLASLRLRMVKPDIAHTVGA